MPGGISLFLLWAAPITAMFVGAIVGVVIYKQGVKRAGRTAFNGFRRLFFNQSYQKYLRNQQRLYRTELSKGVRLSKRFQKGYSHAKPNFFQRGLQAAHLKRYQPRQLSQREREWRQRKDQKIQAYFNKHNVAFENENPNTTHKEHAKRNVVHEYVSRRDYIKTDRISSIAVDSSTLSTSSEQIAQKFEALKTQESFKEQAVKNKNNNLFNRMFVTTNDGKNLSLESFVTKDKEAFYDIGVDILKHISSNVPDSVYPIKISQTVVENNKEVRKEQIFKKIDVIKLAKDYEESLKQNKKTNSNEYDNQR